MFRRPFCSKTRICPYRTTEISKVRTRMVTRPYAHQSICTFPCFLQPPLLKFAKFTLRVARAKAQFLKINRIRVSNGNGKRVLLTHITKSANCRLAASASVFDRGAGVAMHTSAIAKCRAAMAREAHVFDREAGVARHMPLIAERREARAGEACGFDRGSGVARHTPSVGERRAARA